MSNHLLLTLHRDSDGTGELVAQVCANGFSGLGSAWFNLEAIDAFGRTLSESFPLCAGPASELKGGFWSSQQPNTIEQVHLGIRFYPIGSTGLVGCRVELATPKHQQDRADSIHSVAVELHTYYEQLLSFGLSLSDLANGTVTETILQTSA